MAMQFLQPFMLWTLLLLPLLLGAYLWLLRKKPKKVAYFSTVSWILQNIETPSAWRRHLPPALLFVAVGLLLFASARPMARVTLPADYMTLIMAIDVSRSMLAEDVEPSRIKAAQKAAKDFLQDLPPIFVLALSLLQPTHKSCNTSRLNVRSWSMPLTVFNCKEGLQQAVACSWPWPPSGPRPNLIWKKCFTPAARPAPVMPLQAV